MWAWLTRDLGSLAGRSSCGLPWQSIQGAAWLSPALIALAWKLPSYAACSSAWQVAQESLAGGGPGGAFLGASGASPQGNHPPATQTLNLARFADRPTPLPV